jgi:hypothetical protein
MVTSNAKLLLAIGLLFAGSALAIPTVGCSCKSNALDAQVCQQKRAQGPSWWGWITNNKSSQFHFFQLIELLHTNDIEVKNNSAALALRERESTRT